MARRTTTIHPHPDDGRPTVNMDPAMLASLVQQSITIPISLADLELADDPEPAKPIDHVAMSKQVTQPMPVFDADAKTFLRIDVRTTKPLPATTQKLPRLGTDEGTGTIANGNTWFQRVCKKLHLA